MAPPIIREWIENHDEPHYLEVHLYPSPRTPGQQCAMMTGHTPGTPNPGYMDVATRVTPYPIQTINRGDALREAMQIAEHDG
jgi:hypothetical protein